MSALRIQGVTGAILILLACVWPGVGFAQAVAETARVDAASYRSALEAARGSTRSQAWKQAKDAWLEIVRAHAGAAYVQPELEEIRLELRRASFWAGARAPNLDDLLSGDLLSYEPGTGSLTIRYTRAALGDFERSTATQIPAYTYPAHFKGPWTVALEGTPAEIASATWLASEGESGLGFKFGLHEAGDSVHYLHVLFQYDRRDNKELQSFDPKPRQGKSPTVAAQIHVEARGVRANYAGAQVLESAHERDDYGQLIVIAPEDFGALTIAGLVDSGWIDGVMDRAVADQRHVFDAAWKDPPEFQSWKSTPAAAPEELSLRDLFERLKIQMSVDAEQDQIVARLSGEIAKGRNACLGVLAELEGLRRTSFPAHALVYLEFLADFGLGRFSAALEKFAELKPGLGAERDGALMHAVLLGLAKRHSDAAVALEALAVANPEHAAVHVRLVETLLLLGQAKAAHSAVSRARTALPGDARLAELEVKVVKSKLGPPWKKVFEHAGRYFVVRSDVSVKLCRDAVRVLDKAMERCAFEFGPLPEAGRERGVVYLFAGESGYRDYVQGVADASLENTLGIYSLLLKQLIAWNQPDPERLWDTLRHECLHRYVDLRAGAVPRWFGEGLAETLAACAQGDETWKAGGLRPGWIAHFKDGKQIVPGLHDFARMDDAAFQVGIERNYALSWAWVHYLRYRNATRARSSRRCGPRWPRARTLRSPSIARWNVAMWKRSIATSRAF